MPYDVRCQANMQNWPPLATVSVSVGNGVLETGIDFETPIAPASEIVSAVFEAASGAVASVGAIGGSLIDSIPVTPTIESVAMTVTGIVDDVIEVNVTPVIQEIVNQTQFSGTFRLLWIGLIVPIIAMPVLRVIWKQPS